MRPRPTNPRCGWETGGATPTGLISVQLAGLQLDENMHVVILAGDNKREQLSARPPFEGDSARLSCVDSWMSAAQLNCRSLQPCWKVAAAHIKRGRLELGIRDSSFQSGDFEEGGDLKQTGWRALQDQTWFRGLVLLCFFFFFFRPAEKEGHPGPGTDTAAKHLPRCPSAS